MQDFLKIYLDKGRKAAMPPIPEGRKISYHDKIEQDEPINGNIITDQVARTYYVLYEDADGDESERNVTIQSLIKTKNGEFSIFAFCHLRKKLRQFRVDRIIELINTDTGEVLDKPKELAAWVGDHFNPFWASIKSIHPAMICFMYAANIDRRLAEEEKTIVYKFLKRNLSESYHQLCAESYISNLRPTPEQFETAWKSIIGTEMEGNIALLMDDVVRADNVVTMEESDLISSL